MRDLGGALCSHGDQAPPQAAAEVVQSHLLAIQADLNCVSDLVASISALLRKKAGPEADSSKNEEVEEVTDSEGEEEREVLMQQEGRGLDEEEESEEEVFEGYTHEEDVGGGRGKGEESAEDAVAAKEVPVHVLTELKSVLTVRNYEREQRRMRRHDKLQETATQQPAATSHDHSETSCDQQQQQVPCKDASHDQHLTDIPDIQPPPKNDHTPKLPPPQDDHTPEEPSPPPLALTPPPPASSHTLLLLPEMAAAIRGRKNKTPEESFSS